MSSGLEILGIGSALVDVTVHVDEAFLASEGLPKGGMTLVDGERSRQLLARLSGAEWDLSPGGATANVMAAFAHCGGRPGFIGKVGEDEMGEYFARETEKEGVTFLKLTSPSIPTGVGLTLVTPDGERTFATHLGAAVELAPSDLPSGLIGQAPIVHVEAYLVFNRDLLDHILDTAKANGQKISMDLSSFGVVKENIEYFERIAGTHLDIVFANEDESLAFTGLAPGHSLDVFSRLCEIAVVKEGANGSHLRHRAHRVYIPAERVRVEDTNGAGDAYAGAVLYGLSRGMSISTCGRMGTRAGSLVVGQRGARSNAENARILRDFASAMDVLMMRRLEAGSLTAETVAQVGKEVAAFHAAAEVSSPTQGYGTVAMLRSFTGEHLAKMERFIGLTLSREQHLRFGRYFSRWYEDHAADFEKRIEQHRIRRCHGELHMEHISLGDAVTILDCLEFDETFEYSDTANDVAFLMTDLDFHGRSDLSRDFEVAYVEHSGDVDLEGILPYYKVLRALVRGLLTSLRLSDPEISSEEREAVTNTAREYFGLAESYLPGGI